MHFFFEKYPAHWIYIYWGLLSSPFAHSYYSFALPLWKIIVLLPQFNHRELLFQFFLKKIVVKEKRKEMISLPVYLKNPSLLMLFTHVFQPPTTHGFKPLTIVWCIGAFATKHCRWMLSCWVIFFDVMKSEPGALSYLIGK